MIAYLTSCEFNQDVSGAKKITNNGSVVITDRGSTAHVLLSFEDYQRLTFNNQNIVEMLAVPNAEDIDFEPPKFSGIFNAFT
jgi:hypothetical protein